MLEALAPPAKITLRPFPTVNVEEGIWKIQTEFAFPPPSRVRSTEVMAKEEMPD